MAITRLMDMRMQNEEHVAIEVERFIESAESRDEAASS